MRNFSCASTDAAWHEDAPFCVACPTRTLVLVDTFV